MTTFTAAFAYDLSCYARLEIEAGSAEEATAKAKAMLRDWEHSEAGASDFDVDWNSQFGFRIVEVTDAEREKSLFEGITLEQLQAEDAAAQPAKRWACTKCGGFNVYADAYVGLNDETDVRQYDQTYCDDCEGECNVDEVTTGA